MISTKKPGTPEELVHFGVKGMRWGIRNEKDSSGGKPAQSKPIGSIKQKQIQYHQFQANRAQKSIDQIKANPSKWSYIQKQRDQQVKDLEKWRDQNLKDIKNIKEGHLTDFEKKAAIGAGITAAVLLAYGAYKLNDSGQINQFKMRNTPLKTKDILSRKMTTKQIMDEVIPGINPGKGLGTKMNCRRCTLAYEMRRRGFDVQATRSRSGTGQTAAGLFNALNPKGHLNTSVWSGMFSGGKKTPADLAFKSGLGKNSIPISFNPKGASKAIFDDLNHLTEEGSRGELCMSWRFGGAHSMAWEKIGGKVHIFDTQMNKHYSTPEEFDDIASKMGRVAWTRLDNIDLNEEFLTRWVTNAH